MTTPAKTHLVSFLTPSGRGTRCGKDEADFVLITTENLELVDCKSCLALVAGDIRVNGERFYYFKRTYDK